MAAPNRPPDAIVFPEGLLAAKYPGFGDRLVAINELFGPVFGCRRVNTHPPDGVQLVNYCYPFGNPFKGLLFPVDHPTKAKEPAYDWYRARRNKTTRQWVLDDAPVIDHNDHGGGILFGFSKPDPPVVDDLGDLVDFDGPPLAVNDPAETELE